MKYALLEEAGDLKTGTILSEAESSCQVELDSGRRVKAKLAQVLLRFDAPASRALLPAAQSLADGMELDFLWECAPKAEFGFEEFASDYFGSRPDAVQSAGLLIKLQSAPIYFQRRGKGRYQPAPMETIQLALAAVERRKAQEAQVQAWCEQMQAGVLPEPIAQQALRLITRPDKMSLEFKAFDKAMQALKVSGEKLLLQLGAFSSPRAIHQARFELEHFPKGTGFAPPLLGPEAEKRPQPPAPAGKVEAAPKAGLAGLGQLAGLAQLKQLVKGPARALDLSPAEPFSIDDSTTTEIDDCLSVQTLPDGRYRIGVHIAAPGWGIEHDSPLDRAARDRMSTVYMPGEKITMLPAEAVARYSLDAGRQVPALSLYADLDDSGCKVLACHSQLEMILVAANLRHDQLDGVVTEEALESPSGEAGLALQRALPQAPALQVLWRLTLALCAERERVRGKPEPRFRTDFSFYVEGETVRIVQRRRDAPLDRIVAELMILANSRWGRVLADHKTAGLYRSQQAGRVRMSTHALPHEGLGVAQYMWSTSPLRRYVDLVNQRQLLAALRDAPAPYAPRDPGLFAVLSGFDVKYGAYADIQDRMERYWCLRWLQQSPGRRIYEAVRVRDETVRLTEAPLYFRMAGLPDMAPGRRFEVEILETDLLELSVGARFVRLAQGAEVVEVPEEEVLEAEVEAASEPAADALIADDLAMTEQAADPLAEVAGEAVPATDAAAPSDTGTPRAAA